LHVDRVTSAIVNGYPFSSFFFFCATWKGAKNKTKKQTIERLHYSCPSPPPFAWVVVYRPWHRAL
jgi:hypothetical protein